MAEITLQPNHRYRILGRSGLRYIGQTALGRTHVFEGGRGLEQHDDGRLHELIERGDVVDEGPGR